MTNGLTMDDIAGLYIEYGSVMNEAGVFIDKGIFIDKENVIVLQGNGLVVGNRNGNWVCEDGENITLSFGNCMLCGKIYGDSEGKVLKLWSKDTCFELDSGISVEIEKIPKMAVCLSRLDDNQSWYIWRNIKFHDDGSFSGDKNGRWIYENERMITLTMDDCKLCGYIVYGWTECGGEDIVIFGLQDEQGCAVFGTGETYHHCCRPKLLSSDDPFAG